MDHAAADGRDDAPLILIVDDERDIADMLESNFRLEGYRTIVAHDAAGALPSLPRTARSEVRMSLAWENGGLELAVADDGPGFADAALARATEPFWGSQRAGAVTSASGSTSPACSPRSTVEGSRWPTVRAAARSRARRSPPRWLKAAQSQTEAAT